MEILERLHPATLALLAGLFTWGVTACGAALVFLTRTVSRRLLDSLLGFACGVMIAASFWSLLAPAIELAESGPTPAWFPPAIGFLLGALALRGVDTLLPHLHLGLPIGAAEGVPTQWRRTTLFVLAITLHNIPEGLAVGVAVGAAAAGVPEASFAGAIALTVGIGLQNFPEGLAVAMPLRREGLSRVRSFWFGQLSGMVEPAAAVLGAVGVLYIQAVLPYAMAFAAGAMVFVVLEDAIPEAERSGNVDLAAMSAVIGFVVMMILDVALG
ncbi:MAG TPA: ZIP family metal transporter [Rhodothermia bacterium]|nr:ZIP family metal transporter [Rhodothermia bacterium]